jgi:hypothetical protein
VERAALVLSFNEAWLIFGIVFALAAIAVAFMPKIDHRRLD